MTARTKDKRPFTELVGHVERVVANTWNIILLKVKFCQGKLMHFCVSRLVILVFDVQLYFATEVAPSIRT